MSENCCEILSQQIFSKKILAFFCLYTFEVLKKKFGLTLLGIRSHYI